MTTLFLSQIPAKVQKELARIAKVKVLTGRSLKSHDLEDLRDEPFFRVLSDALRYAFTFMSGVSLVERRVF